MIKFNISIIKIQQNVINLLSTIVKNRDECASYWLGPNNNNNGAHLNWILLWNRPWFSNLADSSRDYAYINAINTLISIPSKYQICVSPLTWLNWCVIATKGEESRPSIQLPAMIRRVFLASLARYKILCYCLLINIACIWYPIRDKDSSNIK